MLIVCHGQACAPAAAMTKFKPNPDLIHAFIKGGRENRLEISSTLSRRVGAVADIAGVAVGVKDVFEPEAREIRDEVTRETRRGSHGSRR